MAPDDSKHFYIDDFRRRLIVVLLETLPDLLAPTCAGKHLVQGAGINDQHPARDHATRRAFQ